MSIWNGWLALNGQTIIKISHPNRYFSDTSDRTNENAQSVSPVPPSQNIPTTIIEIDAASNELSSHRKQNPQRNLLQVKPTFDTSTAKITTPQNNNNNSRYIHENYTRNPATLSIDTRLNEWLIKHNIDAVSRNIILSESFSYEDFVYELEKTDLHRIGLK